MNPVSATLDSCPTEGAGLFTTALAGRRLGFAPRRRIHRGPAAEVLAGALLILLWALLWSVFVEGVVEPARGLREKAEAHPSLGGEISTPSSVRPVGGAAGTVDRMGAIP